VVVVHHVFRPDDSPQELEVGAVLPAHATAVGKVLLASRPAMARALADAPLDAFTPRTVVDPAVLLVELQAARARGWAEQQGEYRLGVGGIAAPVHGPGGLVVGALGVSGPVGELFAEAARPALRAMVVEAAAAVSRELAT
jgi:DNA-binding IclR family transcriptional regulator